jgi:hypothetical protein
MTVLAFGLFDAALPVEAPKRSHQQSPPTSILGASTGLFAAEYRRQRHGGRPSGQRQCKLHRPRESQ